MEKIYWQISVAAFMQPLQYDLRSLAAKDNSITNAATARSNLDAAIYIAGTILQLQSTMEFHWQLIRQQHLQSIYIEGTILELQITMQFHQQLVHQQHLQPHLQCGNDPTVANHNGILSTTHARKTVDTPFTMRNRSENDPRMIRTYPSMIRPHTRPSRTRRTAKVDHRGPGTHFVWKNIGFRASAISQKRISCETSSKTPSATPPPAPLAMPFAVRERS